MQHKAFILLLLLSTAALCLEENIRFADGQQMRRHHNQPAPNADNLTVHVIAHSHDDVGWLKTVDDYYYGANQQIQWAAVQFTIDTVVTELAANPNYKFSIVQMAFLYRWWNNANETERSRMKTLVKNGQLEFINAGWCMSDQAATYYEDVVDQMTIGLRWLKDTFDYVPDVAWHIDPFGHQSSSASIFNQMGYQSFFFARIDYQDKQKRMNEKSMEMIWKPTQTVADQTGYIFTHVNYYHYSPPPGFCFDTLCKPEPIRDDPNMQGYNLKLKSDALVNYFKSMSLHFRTNNLMHTFGEDFTFANARMWFKNLDKLFNYINSKPQYGVKFQYSTPSTYIKAIQTQNQTYPTKTDDFFPYSDNQNSFWTGYFTSRVSVKGFVRDFGRWLQATRKHISEIKIRGTSDTINKQKVQLEKHLWNLEMAMGILQHHDGVSGTSKQKVADDYIETALRAINGFTPFYRKIIQQQVLQQIGQTPKQSEIFFNLFWNDTAKTTGVSQSLSANKTILLSLYNSGAAEQKPIKIYVPDMDLRIISSSNTSLVGDVICTDSTNTGNCQLFFHVDFPQSGNAYVKITPDSKTPSAKVVKVKQLTVIDSAKQFKLSPSASIKITKQTQKFDLNLNGTLQTFMINYNYYESYQGDGQKSGAYIFRPADANGTSKKYSTAKSVHYAEGEQMVVIILQGDKIYTKVYFSKITGYVNLNGFQIESRINSIDITDKIGKQITLNLLTNYNNDNTFYTDSNGLEEQIRKINFRPTWPLVVFQPIAGNYYPINSHIGITDVSSKKTVTILTDRSQGGSVLKNGEIELMIHRRTLMDDARGVGEPLNETQADGKGLIQNVRHYVVFGNGYRNVQKNNDQKISISIADTSSQTFSKYSPGKVSISVPNTVKLYMRPFTDDSYLVRFQSFNPSLPSINFPTGWKYTEYTLSANQLLTNWKSKQYKWKSENKNNGEQQEQQIKDYFSPVKTVRKWILNIFSSQSVPQTVKISQNSENEVMKLDFLRPRTFIMKKQ